MIVLAKRVLNRYRRFILYCTSGGLAFFIDFAVLYSFVFMVGVSPFIGRFFSFLCGATFTWQFNSRITFSSSSPRYKKISGWLVYMGIALFGGSVNYTAYWLTLFVLQSQSVTALFLGVGVGACAGLTVNYLIASLWFFAKRKQYDKITESRVMANEKYENDNKA